MQRVTNVLRPLILGCAAALCLAEGLGQFESSNDVGVTPQKGKVEFDASTGDYRVTGGGANMWASTDAFQFVWKKMPGDMAFSADVRFVGSGAVAHRKAALMIRQSLEPGSAYADVALHGDGLTSLQYRPTAAAETLEVKQEAKSDLSEPVRIRIERRGNNFTMLAGKPGGPLTTTGPASVTLQDPVYVGLAVCSHDANVLETAVFSNVSLQALPPARPPQPRYRSRISIFDLRDKSTRTVFQADQVFEAPNWSNDGKYLLANSGGRLYRIPVDGSAGATPKAVNIDPALRLNNDHAPSPDGKLIAFSASSPSSRQSQVYLSNADGSNAHLMVTATPSYFHGWSPDGKYLAYVHQHPGANGAPANYDIFRIPATGGEAQQLDANTGYDDGPDYSPDGKWIYFNSDRSGGWDIWRIPAGGAGLNDEKAERVTSDELEDWFPHPSPDSKWLLFLSFAKGVATHNDKLPGTQLRMMPMPGTRLAKTPQIQVVTTFFGGQGTINVNSWAPDSKRFAFVIYEPLPAADAAR
jgi:Tol biopolymer transport system component